VYAAGNRREEQWAGVGDEPKKRVRAKKGLSDERLRREKLPYGPVAVM
jgi:hypothetical protein